MYNSVRELSDSDGEAEIPPTQPEAKPGAKKAMAPKPKKTAAKTKPAPEGNSDLHWDICFLFIAPYVLYIYIYLC